MVLTNISGPILPCSGGSWSMASFIPTETGLILIHDSCEHNLYELRGETFATLKWIMVTQQLPSRADFYSVGFNRWTCMLFDTNNLTHYHIHWYILGKWSIWRIRRKMLLITVINKTNIKGQYHFQKLYVCYDTLMWSKTWHI